MKILKRLFALIITISILGGNVNVVQAETIQDETVYLNSVINAYLVSNGIYSDGIVISNAIPVQMLDSSDQQNIYLLKRNSVIIAKIAIIRKDNQYSSCFDTDTKEFNSIYRKNAEVSLVKKNHAIFALIDSKTVVLYENPDKNVTLNQADLKSMKKEKVVFGNSLSQTIQPLNSTELKQLNVARVPNVTINGAGQCWAASTAMMVNYKKGTALTATDIYNKCVISDLIKFYGTPRGTIEWVRYSYGAYGISIVNQAGGIIYPRIYSLLSNNVPIHMDFYSSSGSGHALVLCGSYYDGSNLVYIFRDPNKENTVSVVQSLSAVTDATYIKYNDGSTLYDTCTHTYYY